MTQYNTFNLKLSNLQLNKLNSGIKNGTQVTYTQVNHSNIIRDDKTDFTHKLLLTNTRKVINDLIKK